MNGRQRLNAILARQPADRLAWTTLVDDATLAGVPPHLRGGGGIAFYRHLGCDILLLNGWNTPHAFRSPELVWDAAVTVERRQEGDREFTTWRTPQGALTAVHERAHPLKYPVDSLAALRIYRQMWEGARFIGHDDRATLAALDGLIGDDGVVTRFWGPSTIPRLLEEEMGTANFYYLLADHPQEMDGLIRCLHERELEAFTWLAAGPCSSVTLVENTSTYYISPAIYARYNMPHQRDFVEIAHAAGKTALLHMCGHVRALLPLIKETGCDGIHALTPPPTGDAPWEAALDALGEDTVILGCLDPTIFAAGPLAEIAPALDRLITPRLRAAPFVLAPFADGIRVEIERFYAVRDWMARRGQG